ncbi:hypothetical protein HHK36_011282 [Tetracentron sinense]|uniref:HECT-type E3 ubiquitin transferase n=1 Tax=Tetracentron sinense TaxID=13715 RepID=A0A834ZCA4_TETSI|nr:hypothetical protein HHK36_011282 [Tetracentron sinense]
MRLIIALTDLKAWKSIDHENLRDADTAVKNLVKFIGTGQSGLYSYIRGYIIKLDAHITSRRNSGVQTDDRFLITASAITLALRPFNVAKLDANDSGHLDVQGAAELYCVFLLTVPWLAQRLPAVILPALKHTSILSLCLRTLLESVGWWQISKEKIFVEMSKLDQSKASGSCPKGMPHVGWALANIVNLATEHENDCLDPGRFTQGLNFTLYVHVVCIYAEKLLASLENVGWIMKENQEFLGNVETAVDTVEPDIWGRETIFGSLKMSYIDLFKSIYQQWHLMKLLAMMKKNDLIQETDILLPNQSQPYLGKLELLDISYFYSFMLRIYSSLNPMGGLLPVLNMLSFTPGFLVDLWRTLESSFFHGKDLIDVDNKPCTSRTSGSQSEEIFAKKQRRTVKDAGNKWVTVLQKITGKSPSDVDYLHSINGGQPSPCQVDGDSCNLWDVEPLRRGPQGISKDMSCLLHLFCAIYSHLLLVLDDIEFYEKQVPFRLEQQRQIASVLNTLVYNGLSHSNSQQNRPLMDAAVRCLHLLYERDCRHQFCPAPLWLSPARKGRPPIAAAARTHEVVSANLRSGDTLTTPSMGSVITTTPHVFPFEERVQMFREFIKLDKASRRMAGEVAGPGPRSIEIVVRRGFIVEDGFKQLNSLGSRLKSIIHVSFVSECGLPEAGLDYGGLSKEFLTDISRAAFDPEYRLFSQTSTSERLLIPNAAARLLENGIQMIEFIGRVVGKALYEGILLDYSFSHVFVQKLLGRYSFLDELSTLDPELYRNLMHLKHYDGDVKELALDFTVTEELLDKRVVTELKPGGKDVAVTNENKLQYVHAIADYKLNRQILPLANAFYRGLIDLITPSWLSLFNASEFNQEVMADIDALEQQSVYGSSKDIDSDSKLKILPLFRMQLFQMIIVALVCIRVHSLDYVLIHNYYMQLLSGGNHDIDVEDLRNNTRYTGGYAVGSRTVKLFWEVITGFEPKERCMLLKFVTSCSRAPLLGFKHLQPTFTIHKVFKIVFDRLQLPTYKRPSTLRAKLLYAISSNAGFELS